MNQYFKKDKKGNKVIISRKIALNEVSRALVIKSYDAIKLIHCGFLPEINGFTFGVEKI